MEIWLSAKEVGALCKIAVRTVQSWGQNGFVPRNDRGEYEAIAAVHKRLAELEEKVNQGPTQNLQERKLRAQAEKLEAEVKLLELSLLEKRGEVISAADVERDWVDLVTRTQTRMLGIPAAIARSLADESDVAQVEAILTDSIRKALDAMKHEPTA